MMTVGCFVSHLENRFVSKLSVLEISSAENKIGECCFLNFLCRSTMNTQFNSILEIPSNKQNFESRIFQIHIKYLDYIPLFNT